MAQTHTSRLNLAKDDGDESVLSWRGHNNSNLDIIDDFADDISDSIANFETNPASSNHAAGTYFMLENTLHQAKSAIASGESITSSNAEPITIAQVLNTLNGNVSALQDSVVRVNRNYLRNAVISVGQAGGADSALPFDIQVTYPDGAENWLRINWTGISFIKRINNVTVLTKSVSWTS